MKNLLVPIDLSEISITVITRAACLAQYSASKIWLLHVVSPDIPKTPFYVDRNLLRKESADELLRQRDQLRQFAVYLREADLHVSPYHKVGNVGKVIVKEAHRIEADLIIMGTHRHGALYHAFFGGVGQKVMRISSCPVMLVPKHETRPCEYWKQKIFSLAQTSFKH